MLLRQEVFGSLGFKSSIEVVCTELEDVVGIGSQDFTVQGVQFVDVGRRQRHPNDGGSQAEGSCWKRKRK